MAYYNTKKNLLKSRDTYSRYYDDLRGVDFSSDHTQVHERRLAYLVNMYKDYQSGQGKALETVAGFRRRVVLPEEPEIYGIHYFKHKDTDGSTVTKILLHAGEKLYLWHNYPDTINVVKKEAITLPTETGITGDVRTFSVPLLANVASVYAVTDKYGIDITLNTSFDADTHTLTISRSDLVTGDLLYLSYFEGVMDTKDAIYTAMNCRKSASFIFNNRLYLIDGKNYLVYDGTTVSSVLDSSYVPTTYINIIPSGENADTGAEYEHRNLLQPKFKHTFYGDGETKDFYMNENELDAIAEVKVYGETLTAGEGYTVNLAEGKIELTEAPAKPADKNYPENHAGVEITAVKAYESEQITNCTLAAIFDEHVFLSGNPDYPNNIYYCGRNNTTGRTDPSYFPATNYVPDGVGMAAITGMLVVADTLMVLKDDTQQDGSVYFHTAHATGTDLHPKDYPSTRGLAGIGCLGACINFFDDPVFISRLGVEAIGQLSVRYERAVEHRSSLIDAKLVNMDLSSAVLEEWNGYLLVLIDGKVFMADSRQKYTHEIGVPQYEWYYLEDIGIFKDQYLEYRYSSTMYSELEGKKVRYCKRCKKGEKYCTCDTVDNIIEVPLKLAKEVYYYESDEARDLTGEIANSPDAYGNEPEKSKVYDEILAVEITTEEETLAYEINVHYTIHEIYSDMGVFQGYEALLCEGKGNYTGGTFYGATILKTMEDNLFFGTSNGVVCSFNFDMRDTQGEIAPQYYTFDERTIRCGCATKMDSCGVPHLNKNTVKKSTVIKTKSFPSSAAKIKVRTNKKPYNQIARINSTTFSFGGTDFSDLSFATTEQSLFAIREKEKKWVEKQYYIYSDEYMKPFALYYISYRYNIAGRYKE